MESLTLSNVRTIVGIAQDILAALETVSRSKRRCGNVAKRVHCLRDVLGELGAAQAEGATTDDAAMRSLLERLDEALSGALLQVRRCQRSGFLRALVISSGGRMADPLDEVEGEIDRCLLDLGLASYARIARLEALLLRQHNEAAVTDKCSEGKVVDKKVDRVPLGDGAEKNEEDTAAVGVGEVTAIGVPLCTVAAGVYEHEMVPPPPYGSRYGYWQFPHCRCSQGCWDDDAAAGGPSDAGSYYYSSYPPMFSDDNPNSCSIM